MPKPPAVLIKRSPNTHATVANNTFNLEIMIALLALNVRRYEAHTRMILATNAASAISITKPISAGTAPSILDNPFVNLIQVVYVMLAGPIIYQGQPALFISRLLTTCRLL